MARRSFSSGSCCFVKWAATEVWFVVVRALVLVVCWLLVPGVASAQMAEPVSEEEARGLFTAGRAAYDDGRFDEALDRFEEAYRTSPRPELLFNIGLAAQRAQRYKRAVEAFEGYLRALPDAPNRADAEARLEESRDSLATTEAGSVPGVLPWVLIGSSAAVAIAGVVLFAVARSDIAAVENVEDGGRWEDIEGAYDRAPVLSWTGAILTGLGLAGAALGVVLLVSHGDGGERATVVSLGPLALSIRGEL